MFHQIKDSSNSKKCLSSMHQYPVKSPNLTGFPSHEAYFLVVAKKEIFIPFYSTLPLLLTLKQLDQLCTRSDIPGCTTRKIKLKRQLACKIHQTFAMQGERVVTLLTLMPSWIQYSSENTGVGKIVLSCKLANYKDFQKVFFYFPN